MGRRRFNHLVLEISLAVGQRIARYPLWLHLHELGWNPENLQREWALAFCQTSLQDFLREQGLSLTPAARRRLEREIRRFDPSLLAPSERLSH